MLCVRAFSADLQVGRNPPCVSPHWRYLWSGRDGGVAIIGVERRSVVSSIHHRRRPSCRYRKRASLGFYAPRPLPSIHRGRRPIRLHCPGRRRPHYLFGTIATTHTIPRSTSRLLARNLFGPRVSWRSDRWVRWVTCAQWPLSQSQSRPQPVRIAPQGRGGICRPAMTAALRFRRRTACGGVGITTGAGRHDVSSNWAFVRANESADITLIALASRTSRPSPVVKDRAPAGQRLAPIRSRSWAAAGPEQIGHSRSRDIARLLPAACVRLQGR